MQQIHLPKAVCRGVRVDVHTPPAGACAPPAVDAPGRGGGLGHAPALPLHGPGQDPRHAGPRRDGLERGAVGRILAKGVRLGRVRPCAFCRGRAKAKRRRRFNGHAKRWRPGMKAGAPGELVQVDHMTLNFPGTRIKEFRALCPFTKMMVARPYARATALNAKRLLAEMLADLPFPVQSVQVDGGTEFRRDFEEACREAGVPPFVLPSKSPERNGCFEKANDSSRTEFRGPYAGGPTLDEVRPQLAKHQHFHNHVRPHQSLNMQTPMQYLQSLPMEGQTQSHMG